MEGIHVWDVKFVSAFFSQIVAVFDEKYVEI
jgi:hypothetical protein